MHPSSISIFAVCSVFCFLMVISLSRLSKDQKAVDKRLRAVKTPQGADDEGPTTLLKEVQQKRFASMEYAIQGTGLHQKTQLLILQADSKTSVGSVLTTSFCLATLFGVIAYLYMGNPYVAVVVAVLLGYVPFGVLQWKRKKRLAAFNKALPDCIDLLARSLRAGHAMMAAMNIVAGEAAEPAKTEFSEVCKKTNYGLPLRDAFMQLLDRVPSQDLKVLVTGVLVQKDTGGNLAEILDRILFVVRERVRLQGEIKVHTAQGRLTGWILCMLPVIMLLLLNLVNPGYSKLLFTDPTGRKLLYAGVVLLGVGGLLIRKIVGEIEA